MIQSNCIPPRSANFSNQADSTPVNDVTVQTFYVVYGDDSALIQTLGRLEGDAIALEIIREMVELSTVYGPYLIDKIGAAYWQTAKLNDENGRTPGRVETARDARIVEVFLLADDSMAEVRVVGRESLAVERSRLQKLKGKEPNVLASIYPGDSAFSNPHLREFVSKPQIFQRQPRPIYIMEGRNAREFVIGPNIYDDIRVPGMPDDQWYVLRVNSSEAHSNVVPQLRDRSNNQILPEKSGIKWLLNGAGGDGTSKWFCTITLTQLTPKPISHFPDAQEVPPSIQIAGRVLPKTTTRQVFIPEAVIQRVKGITPESHFTLEPDVHIYSTDDYRVFLLNLDSRKTVTVNADGAPVVSDDNGYELQDDAELTVGGSRYRWESRQKAGSTLPEEVVGVLFDIGDPKDRPIEYLVPPVQPTDPSKWFVGNWRNSANAAYELNLVPIFLQNPDMYLSSGGNVVISYDKRDSQGRPGFKLSLKNVGNELLLISRTDRSWEVMDWPNFQAADFAEVPGLTFIGEGNALIFGTTYYGIKTSGTLRS
ncbi:MAG TPA: hypothetical protein VI306_11515 [Pyrinomonadaceae bacterium]